MALRVIWQYIDRSVTKKLLYGTKRGPYNIFGGRTGPYTAIWPEVTWTICYIILFELVSLIIFCFFWDTIDHTKHKGAWIAEWSSSSTCTDHCNLLPMENEFAPALYSYKIGCARLVIKYSYKVGSTLLLYPPIQLRLVVTI